ncbi:MAG: hypothetical protein FWD69_10105 [Polyangiaceae bacterium]|nr:hypothetical protein [Polyangiaceae bacterium]
MNLASLGARYNLSPGTLAGLASITGSPVPSAAPPLPLQAANPTIELDDPPPVAPSPQPQPAGPNPLQSLQLAGAPRPWLQRILGEKTATPEAAAAAPLPVQGPAEGDGFPSAMSFDDLQRAAPASLPATGKPRWTPSTRSSKVEYGIDPEDLARGEEARARASAARVAAAQNTYAASQLESDAESQMAQADVIASAKAQAVSSQITQKRNAYIQQEQGRFEQLANDANAKIDPNAYWKEQGGAAKVLAALAIGLGQFGASLTGGQNAALSIVNRAVDANIDAQKANIAKARNAYDLRTNLYAQNLAAFGDPERAAAATRAQYLDNAKVQLGALYAQSRNAKNQAAYQTMLASIDDERAKAADNFAQLTHDKATVDMAERYGVPGTGGKDRSTSYVPTLGGFAPDAGVANELNKDGSQLLQKTNALRQIAKNIEEAKKLSSVGGDFQRLHEIDKENKELVARVAKDDPAIGDALGSMSVQGKPEFVLVREQQALARHAEMMMREHRMQGEARGLMRGQQSYKQGAQGVEPTSKLTGNTMPVTQRTESYDDLVAPLRGR